MKLLKELLLPAVCIFVVVVWYWIGWLDGRRAERAVWKNDIARISGHMAKAIVEACRTNGLSVELPNNSTNLTNWGTFETNGVLTNWAGPLEQHLWLWQVKADPKAKVL